MDESRQSRPSGIPRPSRIPVPRTNPLRISPSRESLTTDVAAVGSLRSPKLRSTPSRDQLVPTCHHAQPSTASLRAVSSPPIRPVIPDPDAPLPLRPGRGGAAPSANQVFWSGSTSGSLRRRASQQWISAAAMPEEEALPEEHWDAVAEDFGEEPAPTAASRQRLSLAERTMETLSRLPSSPSVKGRAAPSFYDPPPTAIHFAPCSGSCRQFDRSASRSRASSRPGSISGVDDSISTFRSQMAAASESVPPIIEGTPLRSRRSIASFQTPARPPAARSARTAAHSLQAHNPLSAPCTRAPSPERYVSDFAAPRPASRAPAPRAAQRSSVCGLSTKASMPALRKAAATETTRKASLASRGSSATSSEGAYASTASVASANTAITSDSADAGQAYKKTSAALREQIARARAAKRAQQQGAAANPAPGPDDVPLVPTDASFDFGLSDDPFNQRRDDKSQAKALKSRLETARTTGRLNIAAMGLKEIPPEVLNMYNLDSIGEFGGSWAESVDLTRFVAADNELEMISDSVFPDVDPQELADDEDSQGNIFAGLETLDLHGNILVNLPMGLRRLSLLTSLNLSLNRLSNNCLEVICQITSLKDLKLGGNHLFGPLDPCFCNLENLEILDLHGNNLSSLPSNFGNLSRLRILNISENSFDQLPFDVLAAMPLTELVARKNQLRGTLIQDSVESLPMLQSLDISSNQLSHVCAPGRSVAMPALHQFCASMNRLQALPDIGGWTSLLTLVADENNINAIPDGFAKLEKLRSVDFSSNDIRVIPAEIGRMENLVNLRLSGNPLRDKKFSSISTEEIKSILADRLEPPPEQLERETSPDPQPAGIESPGTDEAAAGMRHAHDDDDDSRSELDHFTTPPTSIPGSPAAAARAQTVAAETWPVGSGGVLDRSNTQSSSLHPVVCSRVAASHRVSEVQLHHNLFTAFPESLSFFADTLTALCLSYNQLVGETYIGGASGNEGLDLPALRELNLSHNHITGLGALVAHLRAPRLEKLDVSFNRLAALPPAPHPLRAAFPHLTVLLASNNHLADLEPDAIRGLRIVDAANNDIAHLNPRIGLLGGPGGLERLDVAGNRFRVPRWNVLERGTEATLRWLRGRVPVAEMGAWKGEDGEEGEFD